ncbi:MAG: ABC transporter ATP-binding protein [Synergistota bacterium]|jgi:branched-chain amino acid transport system ATP-binding protein|nr:ABC transporter ATP-binding protein [Synergistota bacterium]OPZ40468.1 MAG: High-affinity branched-chain amino acid transport ATP-binding protein LivF [Synergistetes bacterium ADurb.BinA166]
MLLEVRDLSVCYGDIRAVDGISLQLDEGELVSVIGANGAGKSSLLNCVMGVVPGRGGSILYAGADISGLPSHRRAALGIRFVPERARVFPRLTVYENILTGAYRLKGKIDLPGKLRMLYELFPVLEERRDQLASTLSGGEQQMLAISRALVSDPRLLLVDEVSMGLMPVLVDRVFDVLKMLNRERGLSILLVEQNARASLGISQRSYVIETGRITLEGASGDLMEDPKVREAYLGL